MARLRLFLLVALVALVVAAMDRTNISWDRHFPGVWLFSDPAKGAESALCGVYWREDVQRVEFAVWRDLAKGNVWFGCYLQMSPIKAEYMTYYDSRTGTRGWVK